MQQAQKAICAVAILGALVAITFWRPWPISLVELATTITLSATLVGAASVNFCEFFLFFFIFALKFLTLLLLQNRLPHLPHSASS